MTEPVEITVIGVDYWASKPEQLAQLLATSLAPVIADPRGRPAVPDQLVVLTLPAVWAQNARELGDALAFIACQTGATTVSAPRTVSGAVAPVEQRLVFTVEEAAQLLGISRSFAYEAVQRGDIPSMRIGRRILVPKAALQRFLQTAPQPTTTSPPEDLRDFE
ncbi:MAG: helix-turn-helix domain-containing protein [Acidimicrobiales bacterium]|jgi:excisionase family DNA binding protein